MWFCVSTLSVAERSGSDQQEPIWEEQLFLVNAEDQNEARSKAEVFGKREHCTYKVQGGSTVTWKFHSTGKIYELPVQELADGAEVFSRFLKGSEVRSLAQPM